MSIKTEKPWIILTHRRTGGTTLSAFLSSISSFPLMEDEPFNRGRKLGYIRENFKKSEDIEAMKADLASALSERPNIKHCLEMAAWDITKALIDFCYSNDYQFLVLTRNNEASRIMSLLTAQVTGVWGTKAAEQVYPKILAGEMKLEPLKIENAREQLRRDFSARGYALSHMRSRHIPYEWLLFEELYKGDVPVEDHAVRLAGLLGLKVDADDERLKSLSASSGQGTHTIRPFLSNYDEALKFVNKLCASPI